MSHFSVLVIGNDVEAALAPFQENNMGDCPKEYLEFHEVETEYRAKYETDKSDVVVGPRGGIHSLYDEMFRNPKYEMFKPNGPDNQQYVPLDGYTQKELPVKELYTWDEYMTKYCGYKFDAGEGKYGYWENPNKRWDWYAIGGRWTGAFCLKPGKTGTVGSPGLMTEPATDGKVDQAKFGDLDWEAMSKAKVAELAGYYAQYEAKATADEKKWEGFRIGLEDGQSKEDYIGKGDFSCFAVLKDGKWYEKGKMGWWACVSGEKEKGEWKNELQKLLADVSPDTLVTLVDCHI